MLRELFIQNLVLIEDVRAELQPGFCVWTGETGAGKSLLLTALGLLMGERVSTDLLRGGAEELRITGRFDLPSAETREQVQKVLDGALEDDQVILSRRLNRSGRGYAYVNDQPVAVATLRQLGSILVDIHGQHESQALLQPAFQLHILDAYGNLLELRQHFQNQADKVRALRRHHSDLTTARQIRQRERALLQFEREELETAALVPSELDDLTRERDRLMHTQALQEFAAAGYAAMYDAEGSVVEQIGKLQREAESWVALVPDLGEVTKRLEALGTEVQDIAHTLRTLNETWEADPERLETVERRIQLLRRLEAKYGQKINDLIAYQASLDEKERNNGKTICPASKKRLGKNSRSFERWPESLASNVVGSPSASRPKRKSNLPSWGCRERNSKWRWNQLLWGMTRFRRTFLLGALIKWSLP